MGSMLKKKFLLSYWLLSFFYFHSLFPSYSPSATLQEIDLSANRIGSQGCAEIASALETNTTLTRFALIFFLLSLLYVYLIPNSLNISYNSIDSRGLTALARALLTNRTLTELLFYGNRFDPKCSEALAEGLKAATNITTTDVMISFSGGTPHAAYLNP